MARGQDYLEVLRFLTEPLDCSPGSVAERLVAAAGTWLGQQPGPYLLPTDTRGGVLLAEVCRLRPRPGGLLAGVALIILLVMLVMRNAFVKFVRWYAAARGSGFVAVATAALRELHSSGAFMAAVSAAAAEGGSEVGCRGAAVTPLAATGAAAAGEMGTGPLSPALTPAVPRPAAAHRWYTPQAVTAPVVCCSCFQPVLGTQGGQEQAQCCELCAVVAHIGCAKAAPHNCRLLTLAPLLAPSEAARPSPHVGGAGGGCLSGPAPPLALPHDWRPAGTTLDLILPPADTEVLLLARSSGANAAVSPTPAPSHGPSSLCLYCGEPCEVGLLAVEPVWRCGGCRRYAHVQCWASLHPGVLSAATQAALEGQSMDADEMPGSPRGTSFSWEEPPAGEVVGAALLPLGAGDGGVGLCKGSVGGAEEARVGLAAGARSSATLRLVDSLGSPATSPPAQTRSGGAQGGKAGVKGSQDNTQTRSSRHQQHQHQPGMSGRETGGRGEEDGGVRGAAPPAAPLPPQRLPLPLAGSEQQRRCQSSPNIAAQGHAGKGGGGGGTVQSQHQQHQHQRNHPQHQQQQQTHQQHQQHQYLLSNGHQNQQQQRDSHTGMQPTWASAAQPGGEGPGRWPSDSGRLARLDRCDPQGSLGQLGAMVLPPTAVLPAAAAAGERHPVQAGGAAPTPDASVTADDDKAGPPGTSASAAEAPGGAPADAAAATTSGNSRSRKKQLARALREAQKWYRSHAGWHLMSGPADAAGPDRWRHFRIGPLPPGCRPLLVFINPRSGPQAGEQLRRQLLQLLHPLQVVDLARELPGPALRCWWGVPGLRVLVIGGDGTVGWVLGDMDRLEGELGAELAEAAKAEAEAAEARQEPQSTDAQLAAAEAGIGATRRDPPAPPPVAALPLGTGNDLARVLGWGGGVAALDARGGVAVVLAEVATAAATPLDRWTLTIAPTLLEPAKRGRSFLPRRRTPSVAEAKRTPAATQSKIFNNYLGLGIDSWCALEFHRMRERYPGWFKSQLGNKVWYGGVGAVDLLARSCVDLPNRLTLVCDGVVVELPPATQGILLLNIPSFMGGLDLWGNGVWQQQGLAQQQQGGQGGQPPWAAQAQAQLLAPHEITACGGGAKGFGSMTPDMHSPERAAAGGGSGPSAGGLRRTAAGAAAGGSPSSGVPPTTSAAAVSSYRASLDGHAPLQHQHHLAMSTGGAGPAGSSSSTGTAAGFVPASLRQQAASAAAAAVPQCMSDGVLEVVAVYGAVHLGQLQVGLARATRLCQCRSATITTRQALPMQVDGEPWMQPPAQLSIDLRGNATMLRRLDLSSTASRVAAAVGEVLDGAVVRGTITAAQRTILGADLAQRLGAAHAV